MMPNMRRCDDELSSRRHRDRIAAATPGTPNFNTAHRTPPRPAGSGWVATANSVVGAHLRPDPDLEY